MVKVIFDKSFQRAIEKIKDNAVKESITNKIVKIADSPEIGKPMRYGRKGTREVYVGSLRLSYTYHQVDAIVELLEIYHKDEQ